MQIPEIKRLAENHSIDEISAAIEAYENENTPAIEVKGEDDGDRLTNLLGAREVLENMEAEGTPLKDALRKFTRRVRDSLA